MTSTTKTSWTEYLKTNVKQRPEGMTHNQWMSELGKKWRLQKQDSKPKKTGLTWRTYMTEQMRKKPSGTTPQNWLKNVGRMWRELKTGCVGNQTNVQQKSIETQTDSVDVRSADPECTICMKTKERNEFPMYNLERYCSHVKSICENCLCKCSQCPFCRKSFLDNEFDYEEIRGIYEMYLQDIEQHVKIMRDELFDVPPSGLRLFFNDFRIDKMRNTERLVKDQYWDLKDGINEYYDD